MTLKEELEILRGEPIQVFTGDPMDIPCIETSDPEKLCKHPVVSVHMITYNHEPYIRQAIEGVMMQKTDFEFELVVGEDCSQDKTREICFEYQKKYPDKIRVLWWHENVSKLGGNGRRVTAHCRGEFIALCEGDDYWIDSLKLQKQVDVMRKYPNVSLVFTNAHILTQETGFVDDWQGAFFYDNGLINGQEFFKTYCYGADRSKGVGPEGFIMTASCMCRAKSIQVAHKLYDIFKWRLLIGDKTLFLAMSLVSDSDVYYVKDVTTVYRSHVGGAMGTWGDKIFRDSSIVKVYFSIMNSKLDYPIPLVIMEPALNASRKYDPKKAKERWVAIKELLMRKRFSFIGIQLKHRFRWLLYFIIGKEFVFNISIRRIIKSLW